MNRLPLVASVVSTGATVSIIRGTLCASGGTSAIVLVVLRLRLLMSLSSKTVIGFGVRALRFRHQSGLCCGLRYGVQRVIG